MAELTTDDKPGLGTLVSFSPSRSRRACTRRGSRRSRSAGTSTGSTMAHAMAIGSVCAITHRPEDRVAEVERVRGACAVGAVQDVVRLRPLVAHPRRVLRVVPMTLWSIIGGIVCAFGRCISRVMRRGFDWSEVATSHRTSTRWRWPSVTSGSSKHRLRGGARVEGIARGLRVARRGRRDRAGRAYGPMTASRQDPRRGQDRRELRRQDARARRGGSHRPTPTLAHPSATRRSWPRSTKCSARSRGRVMRRRVRR